jgi:hypothetical protein
MVTKLRLFFIIAKRKHKKIKKFTKISIFIPTHQYNTCFLIMGNT